jgi:NAD(P)-dependent dehydrogenase (short-subunit alcohol dehydrogenase family)
MGAFGLVQLQRPGQGMQDVVGDPTQIATLHLGVVVDTHPGQERHLLAAQPGDAPVAAIGGQAGLLRRHPGPPGGQELADLVALVHAPEATSRRAGRWEGLAVPRSPATPTAALATTPAEELLSLPMLGADQVTDSLHAYQLAKRGNSLRVMAEAVRWGKRGARVNTISPGIIFTPLATDELTGPRGAGYRRMLELSPVGRGGTPDEVATVAALLMGPDGAFITGSDVLMDGGVTASWFFGDLAPP